MVPSNSQFTKSQKYSQHSVLRFGGMCRPTVQTDQCLLQELYGSKVAGDLISALSRLFTAYLHFGGFTCGLDDLLLLEDAEQNRAEMCDTAEERALRASAEFADVSVPNEDAEVSHDESQLPVTRLPAFWRGHMQVGSSSAG